MIKRSFNTSELYSPR